MKKRAQSPTHPRKRKYVRSDEENQRILKSKARALKAAIEDAVIQAYLTDEIHEYRCPLLTLKEIVDRTGLADDTALSALFFSRCHGYMKAALRNAIKEGVPAVLVTRAFCNDVTDEEYETVEDLDVVKSWLAGIGRDSKAAGILFVYEGDRTAELLFNVSTDGMAKVGNGVIKRIKANVEAGAVQGLPDMRRVAKRLSSVPSLQILPDKAS